MFSLFNMAFCHPRAFLLFFATKTFYPKIRASSVNEFETSSLFRSNAESNKKQARCLSFTVLAMPLYVVIKVMSPGVF